MQTWIDDWLAIDIRNNKTGKAAQCQLGVVVNTADRPYTTGFFKMACVFNLGAKLVAREFGIVTDNNNMAITHTDGNVASIVEQAHAVNTLRRLKSF